MENSEFWQGHIRALIYPVQFEKNPLNGIDRVLQQVVKARALRAAPKEYLRSVRAALASEIELAQLIPQDHSESVIRSYLTELERRLQKCLSSMPSF